jgi:hypothetical protein
MNIENPALLWFAIPFLLVASLFLRALFVLFRDCVFPIRRLAAALDSSTFGEDPDKSLPARRAIERRANSICHRLKSAADTGSGYGSYDLDRDLRALRADATLYLTVVRAAAGVLIIVGLLITLFNLRVAVGELQRTFRTHIENVRQTDDTSSPEQENKAIDTKTVREGMQGIAGAAKTAFQLSAIVISLAALLLVLAFVSSQFAASRIQRFEWWAEAAYHKCQEQVAAKRPEDVVHNLSATVEHLANLTKTFETTNSALQELKSFGEKMDNAAQQITLAVANLPNNIGASMATISAEVAQGINQDLRHQGEYLKGILAIYSDQQNVLKKMVDFIESVSKSEKASSEALSALRTLPQQIQAVADNVKWSAETIALVRSTAEQLDRKVDALPTDELNAAAAELRASLANVGRIEQMLTVFRQQMEASMTKNSAEAANQIRGTLDRALTDIAAAKLSITGASEATVSRLGTLAAQLKMDLDRARVQASSVTPEDLTNRLDDIVSEIRHISLNPFRAMFGRRDERIGSGDGK